MIKITEGQLHNAVAHYLELDRKFNNTTFDSDGILFEAIMNERQGAGRILAMLGVKVDGLGKKGHCPQCGAYLGKRDPEDDTDPECGVCLWQGRI